MLDEGCSHHFCIVCEMWIDDDEVCCTCDDEGEIFKC